MRVVVDSGICQGHTLCSLAAPDLFGLWDEDGHAFVKIDAIPAEQEAAALAAAASCPERAIAIREHKEE